MSSRHWARLGSNLSAVWRIFFFAFSKFKYYFFIIWEYFLILPKNLEISSTGTPKIPRFKIIFSMCECCCSFLAHFPLGKESYCPHFVRPSVRPSVTASSLQGVVGLGWFIACSKAYEPRIWIMVKKILGLDPGRGQDGLKSLTLYIFLEYLWTFYKCVCEWER